MKRWLRDRWPALVGVLVPTLGFSALKLLGAIDWPWWWIAFVPTASLIAARMRND